LVNRRAELAVAQQALNLCALLFIQIIKGGFFRPLKVSAQGKD